MYIAIEGIDSVGKSTQIDILRQKYPAYIFTKEPGGTELGKSIRDIVLNGKAKSKVAQMLLFLADRAELSYEVLKPNKDDIVISDRSLISGIAYAKDVPIDIATSLNLMALNGILPNKVVLLEISKDELIKRFENKSKDAIESKGIDFLLEVQERMKEAIKLLQIDYIIIDATLSVQEISEEIDKFI